MKRVDNSNSTVGRRIREIRVFYNYSRETLAEMAEISPRFLSSIESGNQSMTIKTLMNIASALRVSVDYLLYGSEMDTSPVDQALMKMGKDDRRTIKKLFVEAIRILDEIPKEDSNEDNENDRL